jgi:guanosine-3',5'-bis(diphosphate) 3'-pyrophosphohydrolase
MTTDSDTMFILRVTAFAAQKHRVQRRKDAEASAYINHPIALAHLLASEAGVTDRTVLAAALLHDTVEDTETTADELVAVFGAKIASTVMEVTDDTTLPKAERKRQQIVQAARISGPAKLVKLADKIANLRDINASPPAGWTLERKREYFDWAKQVIDELRGVHPRLEALFDAEHSRRP